jgi:hypothetical protein
MPRWYPKYLEAYVELRKQFGKGEFTVADIRKAFGGVSRGWPYARRMVGHGWLRSHGTNRNTRYVLV